MAKRSTLLVAIGVAVFVLGAGVVLLSLRGSSSKSDASQVVTGAKGSLPSAVVVATKDVPAGTSGESMIESRSVKLSAIPASKYSADDLTSLAALNQQSLTVPLAAGQPVEASEVSLTAGALTPPAGDESMAITLPSGASGLAGYLQPGQDIDIYATVTKTSTGGSAAGAALSLPCSTLVETKVEVLDVSDEVPAYRSAPTSAGRTVPGSLTVLVAVTPPEALKLVFYTTNESLYLAQWQAGETSAVSPAYCLDLTTTPQLSVEP